jgi:hypothetical protein
MPTKSIHLGRPVPTHTENHVPWSRQILVTLATLALLSIAYGVWHVFRTETVPEIPDTTMPVPAP